MGALSVGAPLASEAFAERQYYLLLDGLVLEPLERWLYERLGNPTYEPIYLDTPLAECRRISPCLVKLERQSPVWDDFLEHGACAQWGWLLASEAAWEEITAHLRWLLFMEHPLEGEKVVRVASPEVMRCLLDAEPQPDQSALLGVIDDLWMPVQEEGVATWWHLRNAREGVPRPDKPFALQQPHLDSLSRIAWRRFAEELAQHLQRFFPNGPLLRDSDTTLAAAQQVIDTTRSLGFAGRRAHFYMANILGAHGNAALDDASMPEIANTLMCRDGRAPMERLKAAADTAQRLSSREEYA